MKRRLIFAACTLLWSCAAILGVDPVGYTEDRDSGARDASEDRTDAVRDASDDIGEARSDAAASCNRGDVVPVSATVDGSVISFCIDRAEVSLAQFKQFLAENPDAASQPSYCAFNSTIGKMATGETMSSPVFLVNWCDAYAYCAWAGKRLCGRIDGAANSPDLATNAAASQWYFACSKAGTLTYPYGNTYDPTACNGVDAKGDAEPMVWNPASRASCSGGFADIYDMSGNVSEWEDSCFADKGEYDTCLARGGGNPQQLRRPDLRQQRAGRSLRLLRRAWLPLLQQVRARCV